MKQYSRELAPQYVLLNGRPDPSMRDGIYVRAEVHNRLSTEAQAEIDRLRKILAALEELLDGTGREAWGKICAALDSKEKG